MGRGHEVVVFLPVRKGDPDLSGCDEVTLCPVPVSPKLPPSPQFWLKLPGSMSREGRFDMVHLNSYNYLFLWRRRLQDCPHVMTVHHLAADTCKESDWTLLQRLRNPGSENSYFMPLVEGTCVRASDMLMAVSEFSPSRAILRYGLREERVVTVLNGANGLTPPSPAAISEVKARLFPEGRSNLLFVGRFEDPRKGFGFLLEALSGLSSEVRLVVAGKGDPATVRGRLKELGVGERVQFAGFLYDEELAAAYSACDLYVCPSLMEGYSLTVTQAMRAGAAVVTSDAGALPEAVGDPRQLTRPNAPEELRRTIEMFLGDDGLRTETGRRNAQRALSLPTWDDVAEKVEKTYGLLRRSYEGQLHAATIKVDAPADSTDEGFAREVPRQL